MSMKIILSRKGIDSGVGRRPSPLIETSDGHWTPISIPIPGDNEKRKYQEVSVNGYNLGPLVEDLGLRGANRKCLSRKNPVHFDPDLDPASIGRPSGWKPLFGQAGAACGHLEKQEVGVNDVFLFFGWFRKAKYQDGHWVYVKNAPDIHSFFGWLEIQELKAAAQLEKWADGHPHVNGDHKCPHYGNVYIGKEKLELGKPGKTSNLPGSGIFKTFSPAAQLTVEGMGRSVWKLPAFFLPNPFRPLLSYHWNPKRWKAHDGYAQLEAVARGQEFVFDLDQLDESNQTAAKKWALDLIRRHF